MHRSMSHNDTCHAMLNIPDQCTATAALSSAKQLYRRVLSSWASDLLKKRAEQRILHLLESPEHVVDNAA